MYQKCKLSGLKVKREDIRKLLKVIVPHAVDIRSRRRLKRRKGETIGLKDPISTINLKKEE